MFGYRKLQWVVLARIWNLASGVLLVFVAASVFDLSEQGVFYTFLSLAAAQFFFDLGAGVTIGNIAARHVTDDSDDKLIFSEQSWAYVAASVHFGIRWAVVTGLALIVLLGTIGAFVLTQEAEAAYILPIWLPYIALVAVAMGFHLLLRLFEALGFVVETALARSVQSFVNIGCVYLFASNGYGLISLPLALSLGLAFGMLFFFTRSAKIRAGFKRVVVPVATINWKRDVLPFQLRMSATWISGYVIFQAQVPILFALSGAEAAGRFGIMVQIFQALNTSANIFLTYNIRPWTRLAALGDAEALHRSLLRTTVLTLVLMLIGTTLVLAGLWVLEANGFAIASRFPAKEVMLMYAVAATLNQIFFCLGYYFRARGEEPLWCVSVVAAGIVLAAPLILGAGFDISAAIASFFWSSLLVLTLGGTLSSLWYIRTRPFHPLSKSESS